MRNKTELLNSQNITNYKKYLFKKNIVLIALFLILFIVAIVSVHVGSSGLTFSEVIKTIFGQGNIVSNAIVFNIRMPRVLGGITVGIALGIAGCVMQGVLQNPLASASTLGVSQGAGFGATIAILIFGTAGAKFANPTLIALNPYFLSLFAFIGGMVTVLVILMLSKIKKLSPSSMILAGVALSALFNGAMIIAQYFADEMQLASIVYWTFGDLGRVSYNSSLIIFIPTVLTFVFFMLKSWSYNAMQSGSNTAISLGVNVNKLTLVSMVLATLISSLAVSVAGIIGFVGLIAPHIVRKFVGNDFRFLIPASGLMGGIILLLGDLIARTVLSPVILPIGAITSFLGAPIFLALIFKGNK